MYVVFIGFYFMLFLYTPGMQGITGPKGWAYIVRRFFVLLCVCFPSNFERRVSQAQRDGLRLEANNASLQYKTKQQGMYGVIKCPRSD